LKIAVQQARQIFPGEVILLATKEGNFALLGTTASSAKTLLAKLGLT
jgi:hypothetical protein